MSHLVIELAAKDAYLDSSVILSRKFGIPKEKEAVKKTIGKRVKLSTEYVKVEINRTFLTDAIFLHTLLLERNASLHSVYQRLRRWPTFQRQKDRCLAIMESISDKRQTRMADAIVRLENLILGMQRELFKNVMIVSSGTDCPLAREELKFVYPNFEIETSCTRKRPICSLPAYVKSKRMELRALSTGISSNSKLGKLHTKLDEVLQDSKKARGRNCQVLGDTIICLDAPKQCIIFSTNIRDFAPICNFLGKPFAGIKW